MNLEVMDRYRNRHFICPNGIVALSVKRSQYEPIVHDFRSVAIARLRNTVDVEIDYNNGDVLKIKELIFGDWVDSLWRAALKCESL